MIDRMDSIKNFSILNKQYINSYQFTLYLKLYLLFRYIKFIYKSKISLRLLNIFHNSFSYYRKFKIYILKLISLKIIFLYIPTILLLNCSNPIDKKKKELQNCKLTVISTEILEFRMIAFPPIPKIQLRVNTEIENMNSTPVTIEKFSFSVKKQTKGGKEPIQIAKVNSEDEIELPPLSKKDLKLDLTTTFEENMEETSFMVLGELVRSVMKREEIEFILDGNIEYRTFLGIVNIPYSTNFKTKFR